MEGVIIGETTLVVLLDEASLDALKQVKVLDVSSELTFECTIREDGRESSEHVGVSKGIVLICAEESEVAKKCYRRKNSHFCCNLMCNRWFCTLSST